MSMVASSQSIWSDFSGMLALLDTNIMHTFINRYIYATKKILPKLGCDGTNSEVVLQLSVTIMS